MARKVADLKVGKEKGGSKYADLARTIAINPEQVYEIKLRGTYESFRTNFYAAVRRVKDEFILRNMKEEYQVLSSKISINSEAAGTIAKVFVPSYLEFKEAREALEMNKDQKVDG